MNEEIAFVKNIIDDWDPINLFPSAPDDEYNLEIDKIGRLLNLIDDPVELAENIFNIFVESFGQETFDRRKDDCIPIACALVAHRK